MEIKANSIKDALAQAQKALMQKQNAALEEAAFPVIQAAEVQSIEEEVYQAYDPIMYRRRGGLYEGGGGGEGLGDPINIEIRGGKVTNGLLEVVNTTPPNPDFEGTTDKSLAELVEYGHGYKGYEYDYFNPQKKKYHKFADARPFTKETIRKLKQYNTHYYAVKAWFEKHGFTVE